MSSIDQIVKGTVNNIFNRKDGLYKKRISICRECPLYKEDSIWGEVCDPSKYINKDNEVSKIARPGFVKGCGCILGSKTRVDEEKCIINK